MDVVGLLHQEDSYSYTPVLVIFTSEHMEGWPNKARFLSRPSSFSHEIYMLA